ncbi:MAG: hypothetical protein OEW83_21730 [Acidimicrobiia bacterium]|nr:hypothetical protein [Acidimicrobiia bacterium]
MSNVKKFLQKKAVENVPGPALDAVGKAVLRAVDVAVDRRWDDALEIAAEAEGDTPEARTKSIISRFKKELTFVGAATGAIAAAPVIGTATAAGALAADMAWFAVRATDLIMAIGAANGHTEATDEERRAWVLAVLAFGEESAQKFTSLLGDVGGAEAADGLSQRAAGVVGGDALTLDALRRINTDLAGQVVAKYGARRSALAIGKLLPFGVGAIVGGAANYGFVRMVGGHARDFFNETAGLLPAADGPFLGRPRHLSSVPKANGDSA